MPIVAACPSCGHRMKAKDEAVGRKVRCRECGDGFVAEALDRTHRSGTSRRPVAAAPHPELPPVSRSKPTSERPPASSPSRGPHVRTMASIVAGVVVLGGLAVVSAWFVRASPGAEAKLEARYRSLPIAGRELDPKLARPTEHPLEIPLVEVVEQPFAFRFPDRKNNGEARSATTRSRTSGDNSNYQATRDNVSVQVSVTTTPDAAGRSGKDYRLLAAIEAADATFQRDGFVRSEGPARIAGEHPAIAMKHWHPDQLRSVYSLMIQADDRMLHLIEQITQAERAGSDNVRSGAGSPVARSVRVLAGDTP